MVKAKISKKSESSSSSSSEEKKKDGEVVPKEKAARKRHNRKGGLKYKTHLKRLCKSLSIPQPNKDAMIIVNGAVESFLSNLIKHLGIMYANTNKTLSKKAVRLAFIAQMEEQGVSSVVTKSALEYADKANKALEASLASAE